MQQLQRLIVECSFVSEKQPPEVFSNKVGIKNFAKFTGRPRSAPLLRKRLRHRCFPVNFVNFLRAAFFTEQLQAPTSGFKKYCKLKW